MKALVFVYSSTQFRVDGRHPVKQFLPGKMMSFADSPVVATPPQVATLGRGIYLILSDADDVPPAIAPASGVRAVDYDIVEYAGKDTWPDPGVMAGATMTSMDFGQVVAEIRKKMTELVDSELRVFTYDLSV